MRGPFVSNCTIVDGDTICFERIFDVPIEIAWDYLTKRDLLITWLADGIIEPREGGRVDIRFAAAAPGGHEVLCHSFGTVLEWSPPTRLSYTWQEELNDSPEKTSYMTFELRRVANRTKLTLTHKRVDSAKIHMYSAGWHAHFHMMAARVAGADPAAFSKLYSQLSMIYERVARGAS